MGRAGHVVLLVALAFCASACTDRKSEFIGARDLDSCAGAWPVCSLTVGCILDAQTYTQGRNPADTKFIVELSEPSTVTVSVYIENVNGAGTDTAILWYEGGCRERIRLDTTGQDFITETEQEGQFVRANDLNDVGEHLIEFQSDSTSDFTIKADVVPTRLSGG